MSGQTNEKYENRTRRHGFELDSIFSYQDLRVQESKRIKCNIQKRLRVHDVYHAFVLFLVCDIFFFSPYTYLKCLRANKYVFSDVLERISTRTSPVFSAPSVHYCLRTRFLARELTSPDHRFLRRKRRVAGTGEKTQYVSSKKMCPHALVAVKSESARFDRSQTSQTTGETKSQVAEAPNSTRPAVPRHG